MRIIPSPKGKGNDVWCDEQERICKICKKQYVEAPAHFCGSGLPGLLCKRCEPPIEFYDQYTGKGKKFLTTLARDNPNLPKDIETSTTIHIQKFQCGCSHTDASDGATTIIESPCHPRVNTINGKSVKHVFEKPMEYVEPETIFKEVTDDKQTEGEQERTANQETI